MMNSMFRITAIRIFQLRRNVMSLGLLYIIPILALLVLVEIVVFSQFADLSSTLMLLAIFTGAILLIHFSRQDGHFLFVAVEQRVLSVYTEYAFYSCVLLSIFFSDKWYLFFALQAVLFSIAYIPIKVRASGGSAFSQISRVLPIENFEMISGFRRSYGFIIPVLAATIGLSFVPYLEMVLFLLLNFILADFFFENEPTSFLLVRKMSPSQFIWRKVRVNLKIYLLLTIPSVVLYAFFNMDTFLLVLMSYVISLLNLFFFIVTKYAFYHPNSKAQVKVAIFGVVVFSVLLPFFAIYTAIASIVYYRKAIQNLESHLN